MKQAESLTPDESETIARFVRAFVPRARQPRWLTILAASAAKWSTLRMDDLFKNAGNSGPVRRVEIEDELRSPDLARDPRAILLRFSRQPCVVRSSVRELVEQLVADDAIIAVPPGTLAVISHHSDGWAVCRT